MDEASWVRQLERIINAIANAVAVVGIDSRISFANASAERILGLARSKIIGRTYNDPAWSITAVDGGPFPEEELPFVRVMKTGKPVFGVEHAIEHPDGTRVILSIDAAPLRNEKGEIVGVVTSFTDITERKETEAELQLKSMLLDSANDSIFMLDPDGNMIYVNEAAYKTRGYTREELLAMPLRELDTPEFVKLEEPRIESIVETGSAIFESAHFRKDKTVIPVEVHARVIELGGRKVIVSVARDITERKRAEQALRGQVNFLQVLIDAIPNPIFYKDAQGVYLGCNKAFTGYIGLPKEEIIGKTVYDIAPKELADVYYEADNELFQRTGLQVYESSVMYADGTRHDVIFYKATFLNPDGTLGGLIGTILDITERKRAEEALRASEKKLRVITSVLGEGVYVMDERGRLTFMNPEAERLVGWREEELLGKDIHDAIHYQRADGTPLPPEECPVLKVIGKGGIYRTEEDVFTRKDGSMFPVAYICTPILEDSKVVGAVTAFQDITERKRIEGALAESEERYRTLFESATDAAFILDIEGERPGKILAANQEAADMHGYTLDELLRMHIND
ncbi:MAG TPA: PAS domain S-box protein, partial [Anaerolineae bacterium]|nr:PAS domain S-box protein [Anaerolineae bacterium]